VSATKETPPKPGEEPLKDYAGGWITERQGTDAPVFLKFAFIVIGLGCVTYLFLFMNGEVNHDTRGVLVKAFNAATTPADGFMTAVGVIMLIYVAAVVFFAFKKVHK